MSVLPTSHPDLGAMIDCVPKLLKVDFSELKVLRYDYADQKEIEPHRVWLLAACAVHYNLDFGLVLRYIRRGHLVK